MTDDNNRTGYPSIDKPWLKYYTKEELEIPSYKGTVYQRIHDNNKDYPDDVALIYFGRKISYGVLFEQIDICRKGLLKYGVKEGDKVALLVSSTPEVIYTVLALNRIGAVADLINPLFEEQQIIDRINETGAELLFVLDRLFDRVEGILPKLCVKQTVVIPVAASMKPVMKIAARLKSGSSICYSESVIRFSDFTKQADKFESDIKDAPYQPDMPFIMVYSSGTTGASKGIVLTNDGINATISHYADTGFSYQRGDIFFHKGIMVFFSTGIILTLIMPLVMGISVLVEPRSDMSVFFDDIRRYRPSLLMGTTSFWKFLTEDSKMKNANLNCITYPIVGGEQLLDETERKINDFLKQHGSQASLIKGYGMCELGSTVATTSYKHSKQGSTGYPIKNVVVSIFDIDTNEEQSYNHRGEIRVLSPARMKEYFVNPKATEEFFYTDENGNKWGCTGDIGYMDEDGDLFVLGRANDFFVTKTGKRIYCFDVEQAILESGLVEQCEVTALSKKDENGDDIPVAFLIPRADCKQEEIISKVHNYLQEKLSADELPAKYKILEAFPVKNSGKRDMEALQNDNTGFVEERTSGVCTT